jgi:hypothetical protein
LSSAPALDVHQVFYHRLIAKEGNEIRNIVDTFLKKQSRLELFEQLLVPALIACRHDYQRHELTDEDREFVFRAIRHIVQEGCVSDPAVLSDRPGPAINESLEAFPPLDKPWVLGCPANDEADELALLMLAESLDPERQPMRVLSATMLSGEALAEVEKTRPAILCVGFLPQGPSLPARQLCKRLRARFPNLPVILGSWGAPDPEKTRRRFADLVTIPGWTLTETRNQLIQYGQMQTSPARRGVDDRSGQGTVPFPESQWIRPEEIKITFIAEKI